MFVLRLNPITANAERVTAVARAETREQLEDLLEEERVESYKENRFVKRFRKGGPLEMYNPPQYKEDGRRCASVGVPAIIDVGTEDDWAERGRRKFQNMKHDLPHVNDFE